MEDFKDLRVWNKAHELTLFVYQHTRSFPKEEIFGLTSRIRRSAASVGANIAEGCGRRSDGEMKRFLQIAWGSASELESHLILAKDLHLIPEETFKEMREKTFEIQRMLAGLVQRLSSTVLASS